MIIAQERPDTPDVKALLAIHHAESRAQNPNGATHMLDLSALLERHIRFYTVRREDGRLMGCGALRDHETFGELKSMHTATAFRRQGVSAALVHHMIAEGQALNYTRLVLETHPTDGYAAARAFYKRMGFSVCEPFGSYQADPNSVFMSLRLS